MENLIKKYFEEHKSLAIKPKTLAKNLKIKDDTDYQKLKHILNELKNEGFLSRNGKRYKYFAGGNTVIGKLEITKRGFGFVKPLEELNYDIYIPYHNLGNAFNGDTVLVKLYQEYRGKNPVGEIVKIIEQGKREFIGKIYRIRNSFYVQPDKTLPINNIQIKDKKLFGAKEDDKIIFKIVEDKKSLKTYAEIVEILGRQGENKADMLAIAHQFNLKTNFPSKLDKEISLLDEKIIADEIKNRIDFRDKITFTIDPIDAKDFDDALSIEWLNDNEYEIGIHIADVSFFVPVNSAIDLEARERGTSVYLVNYVIPMLPEKLTNNLCSLVPGKDRLCFSVIIKMDKNAKVKKYSIQKTVIHSKRRYNYEEVETILDSKKGDNVKELLQLNSLAEKLKSDRMKKGSIDFFSDEVKFTFDLQSGITEIKPKQRLKSHSLIEEFMLLANKIVATEGNKYEVNKNKPFIYRIHDQPDEKRIRDVVQFINLIGYKTAIKDFRKSKNIQKVLDLVKNKPEENLVNYEMIRAMAKAVYSTDNIGHYGLAFSKYTHFTSPIRRYPDLMVHRLIYNYLNNNFPKINVYSKKKLKEICDMNSQSERLATDAERLAIKMKVLEFLEKSRNKVYKAIITGVQYFGIFVTLQDILIEGLINVNNLPSDIYYYDEKRYSLVGRISKTTLRIGDEVKVRIVNINKQKKEIDFELAE